MARKDAVGMFWEDIEVAKIARGSKAVREVNVPVPDTGWVRPSGFIHFADDDLIAVDTETKDPLLDTLGPGWAFEGEDAGHIVGISLASKEHGKVYYPMRHPCGDNFPPDEVLDYVGQQLQNTNPKVFANGQYDVGWLGREGVEVTGLCYDVQYAEALLDEYQDSYSLEAISRHHLGRGKTVDLLEDWLRASFGNKKPRSNIWRAPARLVGKYAEDDAALLLPIFAAQKAALLGEGLWDLYELECRGMPMLHAMRARGTYVDREYAQKLYDELRGMLKTTMDALGIDSVWAAEDLAAVRKAQGKSIIYTGKGSPSFTKEWLAKNWPEISEARTFDKFSETFVKGYILERSRNSRVHCQFHPLRTDEFGTVSGRFSSSDPNLQNMPIRDEIWGPRIRAAFKPTPGLDIWTRFDWSQIEFRLLVHFAKGGGAQEARDRYNRDPSTDFHEYVMAMTELDRKPAKNMNFGLVYGMSELTMAYNMGRALEDVQPLFNKYHAELPFVKKTYDLYSRMAQREGVVETILGRRARFPFWESKSWDDKTPAKRYDEAVEHWGEYGIRRAGAHKALNRELQGSAADIMKQAMVDIWESGVCNVLGAPLLTVHDELDWEHNGSPAEEEALAEVKHIMETCVELRVPLIAERQDGSNWGEAS